MRRYNSGLFAYTINYSFARSHKGKKMRDPEKNDLIIIFVFIILLGAGLTTRTLRIGYLLSSS